jgi:Sec-independent protein secretion pathway component TatC
MSEPEANREREQADDGGKISFFDHLAELRRRIIWSLLPGGIGLAVALYFTDRIMKFPARPLGKLLSGETRTKHGQARPSVRANPASSHEQPVVVPQVMHLRQVPLRTMVNWPQSPHGSPS